jgi:glycosyltransferase involved in cell wall biosynthesis
MERPVLFTYLPHLHASVGAYGERAVCYYCIDDMGSLTRVIDPAVVAGFEQDLLAKTDLVFTTSRGLQQSLLARHPDVRLVPNGSDPALYAAALAPETPVATEISGLQAPVLGYSGLVDFRIDQALVAEVARRRPAWSFVFVGPVRTSVSTLAALPNVRFAPAQPQAALPSFFRGFSVGLVPYALGPMVRFIYPTKLNDYAGAGLPVVATMLPELEGLSPDIVACARGADEFIAAVEQLAPTRWKPDLVRLRLAFAADNSWERRAAAIADGIDAVLERRP